MTINKTKMISLAKPVCLIITIVFVSLLVASCLHTTRPDSSRIIGNVYLSNDISIPGLDSVSLSGVKIGLYRVSSSYPYDEYGFLGSARIGAGIGQELIFDHRDHSAIMITETDEMGNYAFDKVPAGTYNIVFIKDSWGYRYVLNLDVASKANSVLVPTVTMYPLRIISNASDLPNTLEADKVYLVISDVSTGTGHRLDGGTVVLLNSNTSVNFMGYIQQSEISDPVYFLSADGIDSLEKKEFRYKFDKISFSQDVNIRSFVIRDANAGVWLNNSSNTITGSYFSNCTYGIVLSSHNATVSNCSFVGITGRAIEIPQTVVNDPITPSMNVSNNFLFRCEGGLKTNGANMFVSSNLFLENVVAIVSNSGYHTISNNSFADNHRSIVCSGSNALIKDNVFGDVGHSHLYFLADYYMEYVTPEVMGNNFLNLNQYYVYILRGSVRSDVMARMNFWATVDVGNLIEDVSDNPDLVGEVIFIPKLASPNPLAGIIESNKKR